jgi:hypothetical protein
MNREEIKSRLDEALRRLAEKDRYLLEKDLSERCIASRLAMYLQMKFPMYSVDVEYNRDGDTTKRLGLPDECAKLRNESGEGLVMPDVIVHRRGPEGPNILVLELKKTTNRLAPGCDRKRILALRDKHGYHYGALIECETRQGHKPGICISEWFGAPGEQSSSGSAA